MRIVEALGCNDYPRPGFGLWAEILQQAHNLEMYSYQQELLKGYRRVYTAKNGYVETAKN